MVEQAIFVADFCVLAGKEFIIDFYATASSLSPNKTQLTLLIGFNGDARL
ncbi:hypothetical protein RO3G_09644 [Rhizopus delemar RA 99-880]|uniref:Uncharacterized protein n=1 Tax=Rhizopus delemar (strain RA 99-880 / ATCC MYA-4621 / FGSC 9543 / NRRL 43880) TaxID=246409 RepID=I1C904_RHIO9|nr:hypothetical protein RO3G_09644 [Rhizopus delemar RA 99-880]|eukprot:EIE84934.1 hypothetical protein RO3G_09644 [Rhizopus delemar RA 99-880]